MDRSAIIRKYIVLAGGCSRGASWRYGYGKKDPGVCGRPGLSWFLVLYVHLTSKVGEE